MKTLAWFLGFTAGYGIALYACRYLPAPVGWTWKGRHPWRG